MKGKFESVIVILICLAWWWIAMLLLTAITSIIRITRACVYKLGITIVGGDPTAASLPLNNDDAYQFFITVYRLLDKYWMFLCLGVVLLMAGEYFDLFEWVSLLLITAIAVTGIWRIRGLLINLMTSLYRLRFGISVEYLTRLFVKFFRGMLIFGLLGGVGVGIIGGLVMALGSLERNRPDLAQMLGLCTGVLVVCVLLLVALYKMFYTTWRRLYLNWIARLDTPEKWIAEIKAADAELQAELLTDVDNRSLRISPGEFLGLLTALEQSMLGDPAATAYWALRDKYEAIERQRRSERPIGANLP
jgi:hypothetical protein